MLTAAMTLLILAALAGALLAWVPRLLPVQHVDQLVEGVHALLPQTQCEQCGQPGCRPYASAVIAGEAANRCAPGGEPVARAIAELLARPVLMPAVSAPPPTVARIREDACIGCTRCLPACPVDAIIGASQHMHTVLEAQCTGCGLCLAPCPVDCIDLVPVAPPGSTGGPPWIAHTVAAPAAATQSAPCINCGACADACPEQLQPHALLRLLEAGEAIGAARIGLRNCTECGACDPVCPSRIGLTAAFGAGRVDLAQRDAARRAADNAAVRYGRHERRRATVADQRERKRAVRLSQRRAPLPGSGTTASTNDD